MGPETGSTANEKKTAVREAKRCGEWSKIQFLFSKRNSTDAVMTGTLLKNIQYPEMKYRISGQNAVSG